MGYSSTLGTHTEHEIDDDRSEKEEAQNGGPETVIVRAGATFANRRRTPMISDEGISHRGHGNEGEQCGRILAYAVAKVKQTDSKATNDNSEVQPRQKGSLVSEEYLGLYSHREGNSLTITATENRRAHLCRRLM